MPFVVTYNPKLPSLPKILKESQCILHSSERCATVFPEVLSSATEGQGTLAICYVADVLHLTPLQSQIETLTPAAATTITLIKVPTPLKTTRVMRATTEMNALNVDVNLKIEKAIHKIHQSSKHNRAVFWRCRSDKRCDICKQGKFCTSVSGTKNQKKHQIKQPVTCKTENVCYLINCAKCCDQYVGEAKLQFHERMNNHKSDTRANKKSNGMVRHFSKCGIENLKPAVLEKVRSRDPFIRKAREQYYIELFSDQFNLRHLCLGGTFS